MKRNIGTNGAGVLLLSALAFSGCSALPSGTGDTDDVLTVATYGGAFGDTIDQSIIGPFEKKYGVKVEVEVGVSSVTLGKIRQQKGRGGVDVAWLDGGASEQAQTLDLLEPIDGDKLSNFDQLVPKAIYRDKDDVFAISTGYYALGLVFNSKKVTKEPDSWSDLWDKDYSGQVTLPSVSNAMGLPFLAEVAKTNGGSDSDIAPGLKALSTLDVASFFDTAGSSENLFSSGEVAIGASYASSAFSLKDKGQPIEYVVPKEGALAGDIRVHLVKGSKKEDLALKFINFAVSAQAQTGMAKNIYVAPVNKGVKLDESTAAKMPYGAGGTMDDLQIPDWFLINKNRASWTTKFNQKVIG